MVNSFGFDVRLRETANLKSGSHMRTFRSWLLVQSAAAADPVTR